MKRLILAFALFVAVGTFSNLQAQHISLNINLNSQPAWGPVGYDYAGCYYFPEIDCYYSIDMAMFHYYDRGHWISARYLPYAYRNYDLYRTYKVVINDRNPWHYHKSHKKHYAKYRNNHNQVIIYNSRDSRYNDSRQNRVSWVAPKHRSNRSNRSYNRNSNDNYNRNNNNSNRNNDNNRTYNQSRISRDKSDNQNNRPERTGTSTQKENRGRNQNSNYQSNLRYVSNTNSSRSSGSGRKQSSGRNQSNERSSDNNSSNSRTSRR